MPFGDDLVGIALAKFHLYSTQEDMNDGSSVTLWGLTPKVEEKDLFSVLTI